MDDLNSSGQLDWRVILRYGLIGGAGALYFTAIGMVEAFSLRNLIGTFVSLGHVLLVFSAIGAGYLTARALKDRTTTTTLGASLAAGFLSSIFLVLLVFFIQATVVRTTGQEVVFRVRGMFVNFSPNLVELLTFGQGPILGNLLLALFMAVMGGVGAAFILLPRKWWRALLSGSAWTLGIGLFSENVAQIIQEVFGRGLVRILFSNKSLNLIPAIIIFAVTFLAGYYRVHVIAQTRWNGLPSDRQRQGRAVGLFMGIVLLLLLPWIVGLFLSQALFIIGLYVMMGLGLNIVVGYAGLLDLGYVAFFAFGAYAMGVFTTTSQLNIGGLNFWTALPFCMLAGLLWGVMLGFPVLRMRGDYLAIVTLGFGEIIRFLALSDWLAPIEGGAQGVLHIPNPSLFGFALNTPQTMYYLVILGSLLAAFVTVRLRDSRLGRQWMAMREDEDVAEAMGINLVQTKLLAFAIGAAFSALAGAIFAARLGNIFPHSFNLLISINALALIIVGGMGSIPGVIVGAIILVGLPELLREFTEYRLLMYGILLIVMMLVRPEGFLPESTRRRELHAGEEELSHSLEASAD
jgi:branched-chain amino acid transport system permease protein